MKIKLFMMVFFIVLLNSSTTSTTGASIGISSYSNNDMIELKDSTNNYSDSLNHYTLYLKSKTDSIYKNKKEIEYNKLYYQEIINEKKQEKEKIKLLIKSVYSTIQAKIETKNRIFYKDSVCVKSTGFFRKLFSKDSCRELKVREFYYSKDSIKIYK